jgi:hypothetical protein
LIIGSAAEGGSMSRRTLALVGILTVALVGLTLLVVRRSGTDVDGPAGDWSYSRSDAERDLRAAQTAADERAAFDRIARNTRVTFALYDAAGNPLGMSDSDWPNLAHVIRFGQFGDPWLEHTIIDRQNIFTLMRE